MSGLSGAQSRTAINHAYEGQKVMQLFYEYVWVEIVGKQDMQKENANQS